MNRIQFQPGLSMPEFYKLFGAEVLCFVVLENARWFEGFGCPDCAGAAHCVLHYSGHKVFQCNACRHQTSLIAGAVFQSTKLPLTTWFLAIYLVSQARPGPVCRRWQKFIADQVIVCCSFARITHHEKTIFLHDHHTHRYQRLSCY